MLGLPVNTVVGRVIPKNSFDKQLSKQERDLLTKNVEGIRWEHRLSTDTTGLEPCDLEEIQVLSIALRTQDKLNALLDAIDTVMPYSILFVVTNTEGMVKYRFSAKHRNVKDENVCVIDDVFETEWLTAGSELAKINIIGSLNTVALSICKHICSEDSPIDNMDDYVARHKEKASLLRQIEQIKAQMSKCKQFNKKVELNRQLNALLGLFANMVK